jgi:hypothetical protein
MTQEKDKVRDGKTGTLGPRECSRSAGKNDHVNHRDLRHQVQLASLQGMGSSRRSASTVRQRQGPHGLCSLLTQGSWQRVALCNSLLSDAMNERLVIN